MIKNCDKCFSPFDSHDGGTVKDGVTYCPICEEQYDSDGLGRLAELDGIDERDSEAMDLYEQGLGDL